MLSRIGTSQPTTWVKPLQFLRFKRTKANKKGLAPNVVKLITQLSVMSAARKQPKLLKLCKEDLIKHEVITKAWALLNKRQAGKRLVDLQRQELLIKEANEDLKNTSPQVFENVNARQRQRFGKRFSLELRIPTTYPPRKIWNYDVPVKSD